MSIFSPQTTSAENVTIYIYCHIFCGYGQATADMDKLLWFKKEKHFTNLPWSLQTISLKFPISVIFWILVKSWKAVLLPPGN